MFIQWTCSQCGQALRAAASDAGKQGRCPSCKATFAVPESGEAGAEEAACHFCGAALTRAERRRLAEAARMIQSRSPPDPPAFPDNPELARLFPADRFGAYAMCDACRQSAVENEQELRREREAMERQRLGCFYAVLAAAFLLLGVVLFHLYGSARRRPPRGGPTPRNRVPAATADDRAPAWPP